MIAKKAYTKISNKYANFINMFFSDLASKLFKHTGINNYAIGLINSQQSPNRLIYSLELVKLKIIKTYIETNLVNKLIRPFKSSTNTPSFFN